MIRPTKMTKYYHCKNVLEKRNLILFNSWSHFHNTHCLVRGKTQLHHRGTRLQELLNEGCRDGSIHMSNDLQMTQKVKNSQTLCYTGFKVVILHVQQPAPPGRLRQNNHHADTEVHDILAGTLLSPNWRWDFTITYAGVKLGNVSCNLSHNG